MNWIPVYFRNSQARYTLIRLFRPISSVLYFSSAISQISAHYLLTWNVWICIISFIGIKALRGGRLGRENLIIRHPALCLFSAGDFDKHMHFAVHNCYIYAVYIRRRVIKFGGVMDWSLHFGKTDFREASLCEGSGFPAFSYFDQ